MMLCYCSKRNVTKLVFFVFSFLQPFLLLCPSLLTGRWFHLHLLNVLSATAQRCDHSRSPVVWLCVGQGNVYLPPAEGSWTVVVATAWNRFGEVEVLSLLFHNKPEPEALCGVGGASTVQSASTYTSSVTAIHPRHRLPTEQTQTKLTGAQPQESRFPLITCVT